MHIVCCTDSNYIMPTGIMLKSLFVSNENSEIHVHVIADDNVTDSDKQALTSICHGAISFYTAEGINCDFPNIGITNKHVTVASYYRLFLSQVLPENIDKVIYLDGDIIVNDSLEGLWHTDVSQYAIGCVKDMDEIPNLKRIDYPKEQGYFNAGVLLINIAYWRKYHLQDVFLQYMKENGHRLVYHDQDVLNFTLYNQKVWLPMKYNVQNGFLFKSRFQLFCKNIESDDLKEAQEHPCIIHYTLSKPWKQYSLSPYKRNFMKIKKLTQWARVPQQENSVMGISGWKETIKLLLKYNTRLMLNTFSF